MERQASQIESLDRYIRYLILTSSCRAQSGHPTSSLSAAESSGRYCRSSHDRTWTSRAVEANVTGFR
jgi:hypothetical protein